MTKDISGEAGDINRVKLDFVKGKRDPVIDSFAAELTAANERIMELEAALTETHDAWTARTDDWIAEREVSDKLEKALKSIAGDICDNEYTRIARSALTEVAAIRAKGELG